MEQVKKEVVKEERDVILIACRAMAGVSPVSAAAAAASPLAQQSFPTPSPFSFSVASTRPRLSSRFSIRSLSLCLRFLGLLFSFASALSLAAPSHFICFGCNSSNQAA